MYYPISLLTPEQYQKILNIRKNIDEVRKQIPVIRFATEFTEEDAEKLERIIKVCDEAEADIKDYEF